MKNGLRWFLICYTLFFVLGIVLLIIIDHGDVVIFLNQNRHTFLDFFFTYWTYLGDGIFVAACIIALLFYRYSYALVLLITGIAQGLMSLLLKKVVFGKVPRPTKYFEGVYQLDLLDGVTMNKIYSFPSGHTLTAFSIAAFFSIIVPRKYLGIVFCLYGVLVGASRIYTLQHFYRDTLAGSIIGIILTLLIYKIFEKKIESGWLNGSLLKRKGD